MFFIAVSMLETCSDPALANVLMLVKKFLGFVQFVGPIIGMVGLTIHLIKLFVNPENKKNNKLILNWAMAILLLFFFPGLINTMMYLLDDSFELSRCWNYAETVSEGYGTGMGEDEERNPIILNPTLGDLKKDNDTSSSNKFHFIGDSRTCGMQKNIPYNIDWICKESQGLKWFMETVIPAEESSFKKGHVVIILLGVNDLDNVSNYATYVNKKAKEWKSKDISTYFVSVNPTDGNYDELNSKIDRFNLIIKNSLSKDVKFIDTNSYLKKEGFSTTDGLHYTENTYIDIYNKIAQSA